MKTKLYTLFIVLSLLITTTIVVNQKVIALVKISPFLDKPLAALYRLSQTSSQIAFIGDSRTKYHIDTSYLNQFVLNGESAVNAGINGYYYPYQLAAIDLALKQESIRKIYISISTRDLFGRVPLNPNNFGDFITPQLLPTLLFLPQVGINYKTQFINAAINHFIDLHYFLGYIQDQFRPQEIKLSKLICQKQSNLKTQDVFFCSNGDGYILTKVNPPTAAAKLIKFNPININPAFEQIIKEINHKAEMAHKKVFLILIPEFGLEYSVSIPEIEAKLNIPIIDMSHKFISPESSIYWTSDKGHLNKAGREIYTQFLANEITQSTQNIK